jgi:hypothetical protein
MDEAEIAFDSFELDLLRRLPTPKPVGEIKTSLLWIIEWLSEQDRKTGLELHQWIQTKRKGWSRYIACYNKEQVLNAIVDARKFANTNQASPILHIEAHGGHDGFEGPGENNEASLLTWDELTPLLQSLNVATHGNLMVVGAACTGYAVTLAATRGPRAPCIAIAGPDGVVTPSDLLAAMKEFYRRWMDASPKLEDIAESASRELASGMIETDSFVDCAYRALTELLIVRTRPGNLVWNNPIVRAWLPRKMEKYWNRLFMIDLYPENVDRFGLDVRGCVAMILSARSSA